MTSTSTPGRLLRLLTLVTGLVTVLPVLLAGAPAWASGSGLVVLGDSYSSGVGTRVYFDDGTDCERSPRSYGALVAARRGLRLTLAACSGATTADVLAAQVQTLTRSTRYVSLSVGGNDLGFADVLNECALPGWAGHCDAAVDGSLRVLRRRLPGHLDAVLAAVSARAPAAETVVVGYPHLFDGQDCNAATFFSPAEEARLNAATDRLDALLGARARAAGARFVNPVAAFDGHAVCDHPAWINGLSRPRSNSYHPDVSGQAVYADLVEAALFGAPTLSPVRASAARPALPTVSSAAGPFRFRSPDLTTPAARRADERAGIPPSARRSTVER